MSWRAVDEYPGLQAAIKAGPIPTIQWLMSQSSETLEQLRDTGSDGASPGYSDPVYTRRGFTARAVDLIINDRKPPGGQPVQESQGPPNRHFGLHPPGIGGRPIDGFDQSDRSLLSKIAEVRPSLPSRVKQLGDAIDGLESAISTIVGQLGPVMLPAADAPTMPITAEKEGCSVADEVLRCTWRIRVIINQLGTISGRIDL